MLVLLAGATHADGTGSPSLALSVLTGASQPRLILEQRQIERAWGRSEDSVYKTVDVPGWRSAGGAAALSAVIPGAGQAYVGSNRAWIFGLVEVAGWATRWTYLRRGHDLQNDAAAYAGAPDDSSSRWSFQRWEENTGGDAGELRALYTQDRNVFYDRIAHDSSLLEGWAGPSVPTREPFTDLREVADDRLSFGHNAGTALWINHLVAAIDALRLAQRNNVSLGRDTKLGFSSGWRHGSPTLSATLKRSF